MEHRSGLLGLAGTTDMKAVLDAEAAGDPGAALVVEVYLHRLRAAIAAMAAAMNGLDILVFTGGIGEHSPQIRQRVTDHLRFLGVAIDRQHNQTSSTDSDITERHASQRTLVIQARDDMQISRDVHNAPSRPDG